MQTVQTVPLSTNQPNIFTTSHLYVQVLRDTAPLSEYGLGLKFMTMHMHVRPRTFPAINPNKDQSKAMVRSIVETLVETIALDKIKEKKRAKEQYCRGIFPPA